MIVMTIGEKIKQLRKQNDITQDKLAEYLNISYQAVSKWENGSAMPDIALVVPLANFFGVSTDTLFDLDSRAQEEDIKRYCEEDKRLGNLGLVKETIIHWRAAVLKYPKNYFCLSRLASALFGAKYTGIFDEEETKRCLEEAIPICDRILEDCADDDIRSGATQTLVMIYSDGLLANEEKAVETAMKAPYIFCSREILLESAYNGDKLEHQYHNDNLVLMDLLTQNIRIMKYTTTEEQIFSKETALKLWQTLVYDGNFLFYHRRIASFFTDLACLYAKLQNKEKVMDNLILAKEQAEKVDSIPDGEQIYTSIFVKTAIHNEINTSKNYTCNEVGLIKKQLEKKVFDFLRNDLDFIDYLKAI